MTTLRPGAEEVRGADLLFLLGVLLIPFDNFFFSPSHGWGAIAPTVFPFYCLACGRDLLRSLSRLKWVFALVGALVALSMLNYVRYPPDRAVLVDITRGLALGLSFLVALDLFLRVRAHDPGSLIRILALGYSISVLAGLLQLIACLFELYDLKTGLADIMKRTSLRAGRIQFTFTEPTFTGMHVYGVIVPFAYVFRKHADTWRLWAVGAGITVLGLVSMASIRFLIDTVAVLTLWLLIQVAPRGRRNLLWVAGGLAVAAALSVTFYATNPRVQRIVRRGVYADASLSARYFRIQASCYGYEQDPVALFTGHGFSNLWIPFHRGYPEARAMYEGTAYKEVNSLARRRPASMQSMPIRLVSEFGVVVALLLVVLLFDRRFVFLYAVTLYVYVQFDSYAFYTLWIHVFFAKILGRADGWADVRAPERSPAAP